MYQWHDVYQLVGKTCVIHQKSVKTAKVFSHLTYVVYGILVDDHLLITIILVKHAKGILWHKHHCSYVQLFAFLESNKRDICMCMCSLGCL